jgi:hypothetical protein
MSLLSNKPYVAACSRGAGKSNVFVPRLHAALKPAQGVSRPRQRLNHVTARVDSFEVTETTAQQPGVLPLNSSSILPVQGRIHSTESFSTGMLSSCSLYSASLVCYCHEESRYQRSLAAIRFECEQQACML